MSNADFAEYSPGDMAVSHEGVVRIPPRQGMAQLTQVLTVLAGVKVQEKKDFLQFLEECGHQLEGAVMLLLVGSQGYRRDCRTGMEICEKGSASADFRGGRSVSPRAYAQSAWFVFTGLFGLP